MLVYLAVMTSLFMLSSILLSIKLEEKEAQVEMLLKEKEEMEKKQGYLVDSLTEIIIERLLKEK